MVSLVGFSNSRHIGWISSRLTLPPEILDNPAAAANLPGSEPILDCEARKILRVRLPVDGRDEACFLYIFRNRSLGRALRINYATHILRMSEQLRREGFETLEALAAFRPRRQFLNWRSYLIAREIRPVLELPSGGRHRYQLHEWIDFDTRVAAAVAGKLAGFHDRRFVHGDLKTRHVLAHPNGGAQNGVPWEIVLVDLEKTKRIPRPFGRLHDLFAARDLVQLCASLPEDQHGRPLAALRSDLVTAYLKERNLPAGRARTIQSILNLYRPGGSLRQGHTLLRSLVSRLFGGRSR